MFCKYCDTFMDYDCAMGYGDYMCPECGRVNYGDEDDDDEEGAGSSMGES